MSKKLVTSNKYLCQSNKYLCQSNKSPLVEEEARCPAACWDNFNLRQSEIETISRSRGFFWPEQSPSLSSLMSPLPSSQWLLLTLTIYRQCQRFSSSRLQAVIGWIEKKRERAKLLTNKEEKLKSQLELCFVLRPFPKYCRGMEWERRGVGG